jgi:hypothetical protein
MHLVLNCTCQDEITDGHRKGELVLSVMNQCVSRDSAVGIATGYGLDD